MGESNNSSRFGSVEPSSINGEKHSPEVIDNEQTVKIETLIYQNNVLLLFFFFSFSFHLYFYFE